MSYQLGSNGSDSSPPQRWFLGKWFEATMSEVMAAGNDNIDLQTLVACKEFGSCLARSVGVAGSPPAEDANCVSVLCESSGGVQFLALSMFVINRIGLAQGGSTIHKFMESLKREGPFMPSVRHIQDILESIASSTNQQHSALHNAESHEFIIQPEISIRGGDNVVDFCLDIPDCHIEAKGKLETFQVKALGSWQAEDCSICNA
jgi:hypothetical protein